MEHSPQISVVVPAYQAARYLPTQLTALVGQTFTDFECIIVDDGSWDETGALLDAQVRRDGRFRVVHQPNRKIVAARNRGLERARGAWLNLCDADDRVHPRWLEVLHGLATRYAVDVAAVAFVNHMEEFSPVVAELGALPPVRVARSVREILELPAQQPAIFTKLFRRACVAKLRLFGKESQSEDVRLWILSMLSVRSCAWQNVPLYDYRLSAQSLSHREGAGVRILHNLASFRELTALEDRMRAECTSEERQAIYRWLGLHCNAMLKNFLRQSPTAEEVAKVWAAMDALEREGLLARRNLPWRKGFRRTRQMAQLKRLARRGKEHSNG